MRRALTQLVLVAAASVVLAAVAAVPVYADAGDEYTEVLPEAGGKTPSKDVGSNNGGNPGGGATDGSAPDSGSQGSANTNGSAGSTAQGTGSQAPSANTQPKKKGERGKAKSVAKATAPNSAALERAILERKGIDDDRIEALLAESGALTTDTYLGGGGGLGWGLIAVLGSSLLATFGLMWQRRRS